MSSYTFLDAKDLEQEQPLLYRSKHLVQISVSSSVTDWFDVGLDFRAASSPEKVDSDFSIFVPDADLFPESYVTDIRARFSREEPVWGFNFSGSVIVKNLFNYYYVVRPAIFAPPRNFEVVLEMAF